MKRARRKPTQQRPLTEEEAALRVQRHFAARTAAKASLALFGCLMKLGIRAPRDVRQLLFRWVQRKQVTIRHAEDLLVHRFHMGTEHLSIPLACDVFCENLSRGDFRVMSFAARLVDELVEDRAALGERAFNWITTPRAPVISMTSFIDLHPRVHNVKRLMLCFLAAEYLCAHKEKRTAHTMIRLRENDIIWCDFMCALAFIDTKLPTIPVFNGANASDIRVLAFMLEEGSALNISFETREKLLLFQKLCEMGAKKAAKFLIRCGGFDPTARDSFGCTALHVAAQKGQWRMVRFLLQKFTWPPNLPGHLTPLMCAAMEGNYNVVELLLHSGEDANARNTRGNVLQYAILSRRADIFRLLVEAGAALSEHLLCESIAGGAHDIARLLVDEYGISVKNGALHMACSVGAQPMIVFLLSRGADPAFPSPGGESARQMASRFGLDEICALLDSFASSTNE